jgi:hypothetical protein
VPAGSADGTSQDAVGGTDPDEGNGSGGPGAAGDALDGGPRVARTASATLTIHDTSRLTIGTLLPEFAYAGGENRGTLTDHGDGTATVFFPAADNSVTPLEVIPGGLGEVQIEPNDMTGEIDFCTGIMTMPFDAEFTPVIFGMPRTSMSVITDLTTETSKGKDHELTGQRLDAMGRLKLVGVALVEPTGDITVDGLLGLPADAVTNMDGTLTVEGGFPSCPAAREGTR